MSRTNHYRLWSPDLDKPIREILGRRNWKRKDRFTQYSAKQYHNPPPRWWWAEQHAKVRQIHRQLMQRSDDPVLPSDRKIINIWSWY